MRYYAGTGDREVPANIREMLTGYAKKLDSLGYILRTGGGEGCDEAFEAGAKNKELILPYSRYNNKRKGFIYTRTPGSYNSLKLLRCRSWRIRSYIIPLFERVYFELMGINNEPVSEFLLCYVTNTQHGCGGHAVRIAKFGRIPVFNIAHEEDIARFDTFLSRLATRTNQD